MNEASGSQSSGISMVEILFYLIAIAVGVGVANLGFGLMVPLVLAMVGFLLLRFVMVRPFHEAFAFYVAIAAFNFYYFYCAKLTGRNPTDVGTWGTPATNLEKLQKDIVFLIMLGLAVFRLFRNRMEGLPFLSRQLNHPILKMIFLFMTFTLMRGLFWIVQGESTFDLLFYLRTNIEFAVIPFLLCTFLINREKSLRIIFKAVIYALPIVAILGIIEFLIHGSPYDRSFYGGHVFSRATATLQNPNNLGGYLVTAIGVYILYFFKNQLTRFERLLFWPTMPLAFACLFMTLSRSSILMFFVSITLSFAILFYTTQRQDGRQRFVVCRNLMISYVITLAASYFVLNRYFDLHNAVSDAVNLYVANSNTSGARFYAPLLAFGELIQSPMTLLFGFSKSLDIADNVFANVLLRNGLIGFALYAGIWGQALLICLKRLLDSGQPRSFLYLICFYVLSFQMLYGFTAPINQNFPHNMYYWFTIGVVVWLESKPVREPRPSEIETDISVGEGPEMPSLGNVR